MIANQYNEMNRAKVAYLDNHYLDSGSSASPAGYATTGYQPRRVGSGVGMYKKTHECPKGRGMLCNCENNEFKKAVGGNAGLNPNVRASLALGAGLKATRTQRHGTLDQTNAYSSLASGEARGEARGCGSARGRKKKGGDLMDYYNKAKNIVETGKKIYDVGKKAYDVGKEGYDLYKKVRGNGPAGKKPTGKGSARGEARGEARGKKPNARAVIVKKIMKEKGLSMIEASKYVKEHNLY
jgi:hypothetical protein